METNDPRMEEAELTEEMQRRCEEEICPEYWPEQKGREQKEE